MKEPRIKKHPYFSMMYALRFPLHYLGRVSHASLNPRRDWSHVYYKRYIRRWFVMPCGSCVLMVIV